MNTHGVYATLMAAREKLRKGWCQGDLAQDRGGGGLRPDSPDAVAWCAIGAIQASTLDQHLRDAAVIALARLLPEDDAPLDWNNSNFMEGFVMEYNDEAPERGRVLRLFSRAIRATRAPEYVKLVASLKYRKASEEAQEVTEA